MSQLQPHNAKLPRSRTNTVKVKYVIKKNKKILCLVDIINLVHIY